MNKEEWDIMCEEVVKQMLEHIKPFTTPISKAIENDYGEHLGSGSFISDSEKKYLITNEHVAKELETSSLAHQFFESDCVVRIVNPICAEEYPKDVAVTEISDAAWKACEHQSETIPLERFSDKHKPVKGELLFIIGYSGDRASFHFGTLNSPGTPYLTQEVDFPTDIGDANYHFAIHYKPDLATSIDGSTRCLPKPPGMSGSLIWNTRFVEYLHQQKEWSPKHAIITGIIWGWPTSDACLLATKAEHMNINELVQSASMSSNK